MTDFFPIFSVGVLAVFLALMGNFTGFHSHKHTSLQIFTENIDRICTISLDCVYKMYINTEAIQCVSKWQLSTISYNSLRLLPLYFKKKAKD